jgi:CRP-like cAMP-binding protein
MANSEPALSNSAYPELLDLFCRKASFGPGEVLRRQGHHYRDMYLITQGVIDVHLKPDDDQSNKIALGPGSPIGEIGFLRGCRATATVVARTAASALVIDDGTLWQLEEKDQKLAVQFCKFLANVSEVRESYNANILSFSQDAKTRSTGSVLLCRNETMLREAMKLRYTVYCEELGRQSPYADHDKKIIKDKLDEFGHTFIAVENGETVATLRTNFAKEGSLGMFEELYGMTASKNHPERTAVCTKFVVKQSNRGSFAFLHLMSTLLQYVMRNDIQECYIDCIPSLTRFYEKFGFKQAGDRFFHYENGPSDPMMLDLAQHGKTLAAWQSPV